MFYYHLHIIKNSIILIIFQYYFCGHHCTRGQFVCGKLLFVAGSLSLGGCCCCTVGQLQSVRHANFFGVSNVSCLLVFYANFLVSLDKLSVRLNDGT